MNWHRVFWARRGAVALATFGLATDVIGQGADRRTGAGTPQSQPELTEGRAIDNDTMSTVGSALISLDGKAIVSEIADAKKVMIEDDQTPYLSAQINHHEFVVVALRGWSVKLPSSGVSGSASRELTFDVLVNPNTRQVVKIRSRWPEGVPPIDPEPNAAVAAEQMWRSGHEVYHGFPLDRPIVHLAEALRTVYSRGAAVDRAAQISADYVMWSRMGEWQEPRPVWAITLRGIPSVRSPPGGSREPIFFFRYIVDARTGDFLCGSNTPRPAAWENIGAPPESQNGSPAEK